MDQEARVALEKARKNYRRYPNVCGVSYGSKFTKGIIDPLRRSIQFFVTTKQAEEQLERSLPRFVYARNADGSVDHSGKLATDVIELRNLELCCEGGNQVASSGVNGTATLVFHNQADTDQVLVLTCSHVIGGFDASPPPGGRMVGGTTECRFQADALGNSVAENDVYVFDIAVGEVFDISDEFEGLFVEGEDEPLDGFVDAAVFQENALMSVASDKSNTQMIAVNSARTEIEEIAAGGGRSVTLQNVFVCTGIVEKGDSGGIVYDGTSAAGIVVGRAEDDWVLVQPLREAIEYLANELDMDIECF